MFGDHRGISPSRLCPNEGCGAVCTRDNIKAHVAECGAAFVPCDSCLVPCRRRNLETHRNECTKRSLKCPTCNTQFSHSSELSLHQKTGTRCLVSAGKCHYYDFCKFETTSTEELKKHMTEAMQVHLDALTLQAHKDDQHLKQALAEAEKTMDHEFKQQPCPPEKNRTTLPIQRKKQVMPIHSLISTTETDTAGGTVTTQQSNGRTTKRNQKLREAKTDSLFSPEKINLELQPNTKLISRLEYVAKQKERGSYDGQLTWAIKDYKVRKQNAVAGRQAFIISPFVLTSRYGYKLRMQVYLDGSGDGKGDTLSLFFFIEKGEYDELLKWPFTRKVELALLSQKNPANNRKIVILPNARSLLFKQPILESNGLVGVERFALISTVESSEFLVNDQIFVDMKVIGPSQNDDRSESGDSTTQETDSVE